MRWRDQQKSATPLDPVRGGSPDPPRKNCPAAAIERTHAAGQETRRATSHCRVRATSILAAILLAAAAGGCAGSAGDQLLAPARGEWKRTGPVSSYKAENLHEYIDGAAPFVISFGFKALTTAGYRRAAEPETTVDVYDMGSAANAFALFRSNANVEAEPLDVGTEGAGADARIEFWKGPRYVLVSNPSAGEREKVLALARELAEALEPGEGWPAYLELLPAAGRVALSEKFMPADYLGQPFLKRAVSARYKFGSREAAVFACRFDSPEEAGKALAALQAYLQKRKDTKPLTLGEGGFLGEDPDLGGLAAFRRGHFLGGMLGYVEEPAADALLADLDKRLSGTR